MKRYNDLYEKAFTYDALLNAYHVASRHKRSKHSCFNFELHISKNIQSLYSELHNNKYTPMPYYKFMVHEPKLRMINAPAFRDLVVQHAIYAVVNPIFESTFIDQSYACRIGKGTHRASDYAQSALRSFPRQNTYTLKIDISKFFYSIDREVLRLLITQKIKDERMVNLMMVFANQGEKTGIPIGNLLSQLYALLYLNPMDHYIKRVLKVSKYCRYMDDAILFGLKKSECLRNRKKIELFIHDKLHLNYSHTTIAPSRKGVNFVGYRTWTSKRFIRKHSLYVFRKALKNLDIVSIVSSIGHAHKTSSLRHMLEQIPKEVYYENNCLQKIYRQIKYIHTAVA